MSGRNDRGTYESKDNRLIDLTREKRENIEFFHLVKKSIVYFPVHRKETHMWSNEREEWRHTGVS